MLHSSLRQPSIPIQVQVAAGSVYRVALQPAGGADCGLETVWQVEPYTHIKKY
jgi:hypothetical protein